VSYLEEVMAERDRLREENERLRSVNADLVGALDDIAAQFIEVYRGDGWVTHPSYLRACKALDKAGESA